MNILLIDNFDSFTYNLSQYLAEVSGQVPTVVTNTTPFGDLDWQRFDAVVISPGPGRPDRAVDFGISARVLRETELPVLGVCLGHQGLGHVFGATVRHAPEPVHGRSWDVRHDGRELFAGLPDPLQVIRYHSLALTDLPPELEVTAWTPEGVVMGIRHTERPMWGVQFHPESIGSDGGHRLLGNFLDLATAAAHTDRPPRGRAIDLDRRYQARVRILHRDLDSETVFSTLFADHDRSFWLDSSAVEPGVSRFSFMGAPDGPLAETVEYDVTNRQVSLTRAGAPESGPDSSEIFEVESVFDYLDRQLRSRVISGTDRELPFEFCGGYVGYLGYELKAETTGRAAHRSPTPDACLMFVDRFLAFDHEERLVYLVALEQAGHADEVERWFENTMHRLQRLPGRAEPSGQPGHDVRLHGMDTPDLALAPRHDEDAYLDRVDECLEEIADGESYEICLTNSVQAPPVESPYRTYQQLRTIAPVPYAAYLATPHVQVLSASPERFLRVDSTGIVESKPIKGTRPRGETPREDLDLRVDLAANPKDRAENLMIVDLLRNDLNVVCEPGSVHVPTLFDVETYATVHQLVSTIRGRLRPEESAVSCVRAAFPGGSMTGAPKVRSMEIIDRLEGGPRGVYSGALGWFSLTGAADLNIVIRTLVVTPTETTFGVGGAIIALSDPRDELQETVVKSRSVVSAMAATDDAGIYTGTGLRLAS
ncbi:MAG: aminodeoxychorismate synthase component I [Actinomycetales bacterium]